MTTEFVRTCPNCGCVDVVTTSEQMFYVNTGEHYCHSVKAHDSDARAKCLECDWEGLRQDLTGEDE